MQYNAATEQNAYLAFFALFMHPTSRAVNPKEDRSIEPIAYLIDEQILRLSLCQTVDDE